MSTIIFKKLFANKVFRGVSKNLFGSKKLNGEHWLNATHQNITYENEISQDKKKKQILYGYNEYRLPEDDESDIENEEDCEASKLPNIHSEGEGEIENLSEGLKESNDNSTSSEYFDYSSKIEMDPDFQNLPELKYYMQELEKINEKYENESKEETSNRKLKIKKRINSLMDYYKPKLSSKSKRKNLLIEEHTDYAISNNIIKEAFSFAYNFDTGISRKMIIPERQSHVQDQIDMQEEWMNDRVTHLEQKAANAFIHSVRDTKEELHNFYSLDRRFKDILVENDKVVISDINDQVSQDLYVADMNPNFAVTEDIDEKTDEYIHEGYSVFNLAYNKEAQMTIKERNSDKSFIKSVVKH